MDSCSPGSEPAGFLLEPMDPNVIQTQTLTNRNAAFGNMQASRPLNIQKGTDLDGGPAAALGSALSALMLLPGKKDTHT